MRGPSIGAGTAEAVALLGDKIIWADSTTQKLRLQSISSGAPRVLAEFKPRPGHAIGLCVTTRAVYWTERNSLFRAEVTDPVPTRIGPAKSFLPIAALDPDGVVYANGDQLMLFSGSGKPCGLIESSPSQQRTGRLPMARDLVVNAGRVWWSASGDTVNRERIYSIDLAGGTVRIEVEAEARRYIYALAVNGEHLLWAQTTTDPITGTTLSTTLRERIRDQAARDVATRPPCIVTRLLVIDGDLYWREESLPARLSGGDRVMRLRGGTREPDLVADGLDPPRSLAVDATHVYFANGEQLWSIAR